MSVPFDFEPSTRADLAEVWRSLVQGSCVVIEGFFNGGRCGLVLSPCRPPGAVLEGRRLVILEAILRGSSQNSISIDLGLSPATVALYARLALGQIGVSARPSRVHPMLMLAATATQHTQPVFSWETTVVRSEGSCRAIEIPRPDVGLGASLSKATLDVLHRLVEGRCYAEIASSRGTSQRTIANQVSAIFRHLGVSGRSELMHRLFRISGMLPGPTPFDARPAPSRGTIQLLPNSVRTSAYERMTARWECRGAQANLR